MRMEIEDLNTAYEKCKDGKIVFTERVDVDLAESLLKQAKSELEEAKEMEKLREGKAKNYSLMFCNRYDVIRKLIHALALFDKLKPACHSTPVNTKRFSNGFNLPPPFSKALP